MNRFYLKTGDETVSGPFTGIELREAAIAQLVLPNDVVGGTADGPWLRAADVGLFSEENVPLPHPSGTSVPEFRVAGVNEALEGPFKLHELIDFSLRQMLPSDASIQPVGRPDWIPLNRIGILDACLRGELSRNSTSTAPPEVVLPSLQHHDPSQRWKGTPANKPLQPDPSGVTDDGAPPVTSNVNKTDLMGDPEMDLHLILSDHREQVRENVREKIAKQGKPKPKLAIAVGVAVSLVVGAVLWWTLKAPSQMQPAQTDRTDVLGNWVAISSAKDGKGFGISFDEDGNCVVFNSDGNCWSGDFQWLGNANNEPALQPLDPSSGEVADVASSHQRLEILAGDGRVRLDGGSSRQPPTLGAKPIHECYVRRDGDYLWIGYPVSVDQAGGNESLQAGWAPLWPSIRATSFDLGDVDLRGKVLLARYGVPDEARPLTPAEITANSDPNTTAPRSLVRYGTERLTLFANGTVRRYKAPE